MDINAVRKVAKLARLEMSENDLAAMTEQLSAILAYVDSLKDLDTEGIEPLAHPLPIQNVFREDIPGTSLPVDAALSNAPTRLGSFFGVPAILDSADEMSH